MLLVQWTSGIKFFALTDPVLLGAASLTSHHNWPIADRNSLLLYGEHEIQELADQFKVPLQKNYVDLQQCLKWMDT